jgi:hypothetical protein
MTESSLDTCAAILKDFIGLATTSEELDADSQGRLKSYYLQYFIENPSGDAFRSTLLYNGDSTRKGEDVSILKFNELIIQPLTQFKFRLAPVVVPQHCYFELALHDTATTKMLIAASLKIAETVVDHSLSVVLLSHPARHLLNEYQKVSPAPKSWRHAILGKFDRSRTFLDLPTSSELYSRIIIALDKYVDEKQANSQTKPYTDDQGREWKKRIDDEQGCHLTPRQVTLQVCSEFPNHLVQKLGDQYIDKYFNISSDYANPEVIAQVAGMIKQTSKIKKMEQIDLMTEDKGELGGTVFALHNYLSPEYVAGYLSSTDEQLFFKDPRYHGNRMLRIASTKHSDKDPVFIEFGGLLKNPYLYYSQRASAAEKSWLDMASLVINLLVDMINDRLQLLFPAGHPQHKDLRLFRHVEYDTAVVLTGLGKGRGYQWHSDGKVGLVSQTDADFTEFMLCVPTLCINNHAGPSAELSFRHKGSKKETGLSLVQDGVEQHFQLYGVNMISEHQVSSKL